eukprot:TRINITY_DN4387_c0_g1_i12.p1 TRINITY_DN4387_c0_g1~~TRINITY_DN4387_c0_g1_i12.p1  ORF type:complete len:322 (-),score=46.07 TRINITY_DN4387_c0_g1_i12:155-1024(-)
MEAQGEAGYVALDVYWAKRRYSHWQFIETKEFLEYEGAYDNTSFGSPRVIVANYVESRMNCNEVSNVYAACCRSECNDLLQELELRLEKPYGSPESVAAHVNSMSASTMHLPDGLPSSALASLKRIAQSNNGRVMLHSHAFELWLHVTFPRQCAKPVGDHSANMMTPSDWMEDEDPNYIDDNISIKSESNYGAGFLKVAAHLLIAALGHAVRQNARRSSSVSSVIKVMADLLGISMLGAGVVGVADVFDLAKLNIIIVAVAGAQMTIVSYRAIAKSKSKAACDDLGKCV